MNVALCDYLEYRFRGWDRYSTVSAGVVSTVILQSYLIVLTAVIDEFRISSANEKIGTR